MTGAELIAKERRKQIEVKNRSIEDDVMYNASGQLKQGAITLLTGDIRLFPIDWSMEWFENVRDRSEIYKLKMAGALIAAEIDRLLFIDAQNEEENGLSS